MKSQSISIRAIAAILAIAFCRSRGQTPTHYFTQTSDSRRRDKMKMNRKPRRSIPSEHLRYSVIAILLALSLAVAIPFDGSNTLAQSRGKLTPQSKRKPTQKPATPVKRKPLEVQLRSFEF